VLEKIKKWEKKIIEMEKLKNGKKNNRNGKNI
jgi:hypothetical protein